MASGPEQLAEQLREIRNVEEASALGDEVRVAYDGAHKRRVFGVAAEHGYVADSITTTTPTPELYFIPADDMRELDPKVRF